MKKIFLIFLAQGTLIISSAQQKKVDSLLNELKVSKADTSKVRDLYILSDILKDKEPVKSIAFANEGLTLSKKFGYKKGVAMCLSAIGNANLSLGENRTALKLYEEHIKLDIDLNDSMGIARAYDNMSIAYLHLGNIDSALVLRNEALKMYTDLKLDERIAMGFIWIGNIFMEQGENSMAIEKFLKALDIYERIHDSTNLGYALVNISSIYRRNKQYDKAKGSVLDAMAVFLKSENEYGVGASLYRLSLIYLELEKIDSATVYLLQSRKIFEKTKNKYFLSLINNQLGENARRMGNRTEALNFFNESLTNSYAMSDKRLIALVLSNIGIVYKEQGMYIKALDSIYKSLGILKEVNDKNSLKELYPHFLEIYSRLNRPDSVLKYFKEFKNLSDTLYVEQNERVNSVMQRYKDEKKEKENAKLKLDNIHKQISINRQRNLNRLFLLISLTSILIIYLIIRSNRINSKAKKILQERQLEEQQTEIRQRISQDIHDDLSSGLTKITMLCDRGMNISKYQIQNSISLFDQITKQSQELSEGLSDIIWITNPQNDNLSSLNSRIRTYTYSFLENSSINIKLNLTDELDSVSTNPEANRNLYLILKEGLHNIQKYSAANEIQIDFFIYDTSRFKFSIKDDGKGFDTSLPQIGNGIRNMAKRATKIKEGKFQLESQVGKGTILTVEGILV
jgi:signal transduction histidine kinase